MTDTSRTTPQDATITDKVSTGVGSFTNKVGKTQADLQESKKRSPVYSMFAKALVNTAVFIVGAIATFVALFAVIGFGAGIIDIVLEAATIDDMLVRVITASGILGGICGAVVLLMAKLFSRFRTSLMRWSGLDTTPVNDK